MQQENEVQHVFLVGAKSLGAYGGYETFVYKHPGVIRSAAVSYAGFFVI